MENSLGTVLRLARSAARLTQQDVADQVGVSRAAVGQWEAGTHEPSTENLLAVCKVLGVDINSFVKGEYKTTGELENAQHLAGLSAKDAFKLFSGLGAKYFINKNSEMTRSVPLYIGTIRNHEPFSYISKEPFTITRAPAILAGRDDVYAVMIPDNLLSPKYVENETVYVSSSIEPKIGDYVIARTGVDHEVGRPEGGETIMTERCIFGQLTHMDILGTKLRQHNPSKEIAAPFRAQSMHRIFPARELIPMAP